MKKDMDDFEKAVFTEQGWGVPRMEAPQELRDRLDSLHLCGRKIKNMRIIGTSYIDTELKRGRPYWRGTDVDTPLLIQFEDGDVLEAEAPWEQVFAVSMSCPQAGMKPTWMRLSCFRPVSDRP